MPRSQIVPESRGTQNFTSLRSTTMDSDVATTTISDESITLPSESTSIRSVNLEIVTGRPHREGAHRRQRRPCRELGGPSVHHHTRFPLKLNQIVTQELDGCWICTSNSISIHRDFATGAVRYLIRAMYSVLTNLVYPRGNQLSPVGWLHEED
ncbi:hypothetical protein BDR04DRAFT_1105664 [Suillus decipiens]|nr:hypothetical protein BDR04DRAFT_1105664 [Suillus decipiens]